MLLLPIPTRYTVVLIHHPLSSAPDNAIPCLIRVVLDEGVEIVGLAYGQQLHVVVELQVVLVCDFFHDFLDVAVFTPIRITLLIRYVNSIYLNIIISFESSLSPIYLQ